MPCLIPRKSPSERQGSKYLGQGLEDVAGDTPTAPRAKWARLGDIPPSAVSRRAHIFLPLPPSALLGRTPARREGWVSAVSPRRTHRELCRERVIRPVIATEPQHRLWSGSLSPCCPPGRLVISMFSESGKIKIHV